MRTERALMLACVGGVAAGLVIVTRRLRTWGATPEEASRWLLGDELITDAASTTRAITIRAPAEDVWSWIIQLGADRGGFYSYDWLENHFGFVGGGPPNLGIHSVDRVVPEWQERNPGDLVAADAHGSGGWYVMAIEPSRALVLQMANVKEGVPARRDEPPFVEFSWAFILEEGVAGMTRLVVRERVALGESPFLRLVGPMIGVISSVMTRKMLIGIRQRAERSRNGVSSHSDASPA